jgi:hypothetical protein
MWVSSSLTRLFITSSYYRESLANGASTNTTHLTDTKATYLELEPPTSGAHSCHKQMNKTWDINCMVIPFLGEFRNCWVISFGYGCNNSLGPGGTGIFFPSGRETWKNRMMLPLIMSKYEHGTMTQVLVFWNPIMYPLLKAGFVDQDTNGNWERNMLIG